MSHSRALNGLPQQLVVSHRSFVYSPSVRVIRPDQPECVNMASADSTGCKCTALLYYHLATWLLEQNPNCSWLLCECSRRHYWHWQHASAPGDPMYQPTRSLTNPWHSVH
jgi:hypothetical protein